MKRSHGILLRGPPQWTAIICLQTMQQVFSFPSSANSPEWERLFVTFSTLANRRSPEWAAKKKGQITLCYLICHIHRWVQLLNWQLQYTVGPSEHRSICKYKWVITKNHYQNPGSGDVNEAALLLMVYRHISSLLDHVLSTHSLLRCQRAAGNISLPCSCTNPDLQTLKPADLSCVQSE